MSAVDNTRDLLFEIGTEEIPAGFLSWVLPELRQIAEAEFSTCRVPHKGLLSWGTPRRIVLYVRGLSARQEDMVETVKGPLWAQAFDANGNPTKAALGFAKSRNVSVDSLQMAAVDGVHYAHAVIKHEGQEAAGLLPDVLSRILKKIVFPKNMYWDDPSIRFARPIRWLVALWGDQIIPVSLGKIESNRYSRGHRFLGKKNIEIGEAKQYLTKLYDEFVLVDQEKRKEKMLSGIASIEKELGAVAEVSPDLVEENLNLVEYPVPFFGSFDESYLDIPEEVLVTSMKKHQRYFPVRDKSGKLQAYFIGVSNNQATRMQVVREGNEKVLRARLSDAAFFWKEDQKKSLSKRVDGLKAVTYQEKLGSVYDKSERTRALALWLCHELGLPEEQKKDTDRAAYLAKADLLTSMVFEFPELQGIMGREYARRDGESSKVALAIYEQYLPKAAGDRLPTDVVGAVVGLAERAEILVSIHHVGLEPTGSQDPYGLRRAARCINEILWGKKLDVDVHKLIEKSAAGLGASDECVAAVKEFYGNRMAVQLREKGYSHGAVQLVTNRTGHRPHQVLNLLSVLDGVKDTEWFASLMSAAVRVRNIVSKAETDSVAVDPAMFAKDAEARLYDALLRLGPEIQEAASVCDWGRVAKSLSELEPPIGKFFDDVLVMDTDTAVKNNRLRILRDAKTLFDCVGDFSLLRNV